MNLVAHCNSCGFTWEASNLVNFGPGIFVNISNVTTNCPQCGADANILDGQWAGSAEGFDLVSGPPKSAALLKTFRSLVEEARQGQLTPAQVQARAAQLDEGFGKAVGILMLRYPKSAVFIIALVAMLKFMNIETKFDINKALQQVIEYVDASSAQLQDAASGDLDNAKDHKAASDTEATKNRSADEQSQSGIQNFPNTRRSPKGALNAPRVGINTNPRGLPGYPPGWPLVPKTASPGQGST